VKGRTLFAIESTQGLKKDDDLLDILEELQDEGIMHCIHIGDKIFYKLTPIDVRDQWKLWTLEQRVIYRSISKSGRRGRTLKQLKEDTHQSRTTQVTVNRLKKASIIKSEKRTSTKSNVFTIAEVDDSFASCIEEMAE
jgi:hypothetical protein